MHHDMHEYTLPALLVIMDGFGIDEAGEGNAISLASTPNLDRYWKTCPRTTLEASGEAVGLPAGQMGNSEVGHLNIGAGRVVHQELTRINAACADGSIARSEGVQAAFEAASTPGSALHLMGLFSDGGVHSHITHLLALIRHAVAAGVPDVRVHCFMDGRDVSPTSGIGFVRELETMIEEHEWCDRVRIASISGRYYAMDRDNRWERVHAAWDAVVCAQPLSDQAPETFVKASYDAGTTDEFIVPGAFDGRGVVDGDAVLFFNFRPDRARQISRAFTEPDFDGFVRGRAPRVTYVCLTEYDPTLDALVAFPKTFPEHVLADVIADAGLTQYHTAETEKYAHVTFFLNGGVEEPKAGETRRLVSSPKVATYDLQPEMSEPEVARTLVEAIESDVADVYIVNFANCDMVGHTGMIPAARAAVEAVDAGVGSVVDAVCAKGGFALITADHGNADKMIAEDGSPHTAHTTAPVPLILVDGTGAGLGLKDMHGALCDIAPTMLEAIGLDRPAAMDGRSLLV